jgi:hypothetical protein
VRVTRDCRLDGVFDALASVVGGRQKHTGTEGTSRHVEVLAPYAEAPLARSLSSTRAPVKEPSDGLDPQKIVDDGGVGAP